MKKKDDPLANAAEIRRRAEKQLKETLKNQRLDGGEQATPEDARRLVQELQIHQIELEMQNEMLRESRAEAEEFLDQYTTLYDFAPVGYFTLGREGEIRRVNLTGAKLLGTERAMLVDRRFGNYVSTADGPAFNRFLQSLFTQQDAASGKASCEVALSGRQKGMPSFEASGLRHAAGEARRHVRIEASVTENGEECRVVTSDITEQVQLEEVRDFLAKYSGPVQGKGFFELLACYLAEHLGMDAVCIDRLEEDGLTARTVAFWRDGKFVDNASHGLRDTSCGEALGKAVCSFPAGVCQLFPRDQVLQDLRAESYVGVTLWGNTGKAIGLIALIGRHPLENRRLVEDMLQLVAVRASGEMERLDAEEKLRESLEQLRRAVETTIQVLVLSVEMKDPYTAGHQRRMTNLARAMATEMGLPREKIEGIRMAGVIHDIGKITLPTEILSKPTKLTNIEWLLIQEHVRLGYDLLKNVESSWPLAEIVRQHHERLDGSGYPRNLKGEEILIEARILAVADVVEAMASHRPYRASLGLDAALEEIEKNRGRLYESQAVDACLRLFREKGYQLEGA